MAKLAVPPLLSLRHFLVLSIALNVSLILRTVYYESEKGSKGFCLNKNMMADADSDDREGHLIHKSRLAMSSTSSLVNSTRADHPGGRETVINLDQ